MFPNGGSEKSFQVDDSANERVLCEGHGLVNDNKVVFIGATLPTGITEGTEYWVIGVTAATPDYFSISSTQGGAAINLTGAPSDDARLSKIVTETFAADNGTFRVSSFSVSM
jgi:hypothetical protein